MQRLVDPGASLVSAKSSSFGVAATAHAALFISFVALTPRNVAPAPSPFVIEAALIELAPAAGPRPPSPDAPTRSGAPSWSPDSAADFAAPGAFSLPNEDRVLTAPRAFVDPQERFAVSPLDANVAETLASLDRCKDADGRRRADCFALGSALADASAQAAFDDPTPGDALSDPRFAGLDVEALRVAKGLQRRFNWNEPTVKTVGVRLRSLSGAFGGEMGPAHPDAQDPGFGD